MRYGSFGPPFVEDKKPLFASEATEEALLRLPSRLPLEPQDRLVVEQNSMQDAADVDEAQNLIVMQLHRILDLPIYCYLLGRVLEAVVVALHLMANYGVRYLEHFAVEVVGEQIVRLQRSAESSV